MRKKPLPRLDSLGFIYQGRPYKGGEPIKESDVQLCTEWLQVQGRPIYRQATRTTADWACDVGNYFSSAIYGEHELDGAFIEAALRLGYRVQPIDTHGTINLARKKPPSTQLLSKTFPLHQRPHPDSLFSQALEALEHSAPGDLRFIYANRWQGDIDRIYFGSSALGCVFFLDERGLRLVKANWDEVTRFYSGRWYFHCSLSEFLEVKHRTLSPLLKQFIVNLRRGVWVI